VMHKDRADRDTHLEMGFEEGWGTVIAQLAQLLEGQPLVLSQTPNS
jgi:uncharacterized protein YndB with AHSA1/START domain